MADHTPGPRYALSGPDKGPPWAHPGCGFVLGPDKETVVGRFPRYEDAKLDAFAPDLLEALQRIDDLPCSMVNDSDSLRHTIETIQTIAHGALSLVKG